MAASTMEHVTIPCFGGNVPTTVAHSAPPQSSAPTTAWIGGEAQGDNLDFDLLAEYLLDDVNAASGAAVANVPHFDFSVDPGASSGVVSPEQSEDGFPPMAEATPTTTVPPESIAARAPVPTTAPVAQVPVPAAPIPAPAAPIPAPTVASVLPLPSSVPILPSSQPPLAPAPLLPPNQSLPTHAQAPVVPAPMPVPAPLPGVHVAHQTIAVAPAPGIPLLAAAPPIPQGAAPMPPAPSHFPTLQAAAAVAAHSQQVAIASVGVVPPTQAAMIAHQHAAVAGNKRRRVDAPQHPPVPLQVMAQPPGRGRQKSQAQIDRRRERNRILARRTRLRKKFFFESLQKEVTDLQRENYKLRELVKSRLNPEDSKKLLTDCNAMEQIPPAVAEACGDALAEVDQKDFNLVRNIQRSQQCFVITDPSLQDNPIVYASEDFLTLTGYKREEVLGRNCRFLQGTETDPQKIQQLQKSIAVGEDVSVTLINYTADGTAFWNRLFVAALRDAQNNIVNFIGVIVKSPGPDADDPEANKKLPGHQTEEQAAPMNTETLPEEFAALDGAMP